MTEPPWREPRPSRPYGGEPGGRPPARDPRSRPGTVRTPPAAARAPRRDPGGDGGPGSTGQAGEGRGDPRRRDNGRGGQDAGSDARTRQLPARPEATQPTTQRAGTWPGATPPGGTWRDVAQDGTQPGRRRDGGARGPAGPRKGQRRAARRPTPAGTGPMGRAAGRPRGLHHRRQRGRRHDRHHGDPERAGQPARALRGGRDGGRRAGRPAPGRPDDPSRAGAVLPGGCADQRDRLPPGRRVVGDGAGYRRDAVGRRRLLRDAAGHGAGGRDHHCPLVLVAAPQAGPARPRLGGPVRRRCPRGHRADGEPPGRRGTAAGSNLADLGRTRLSGGRKGAWWLARGRRAGTSQGADGSAGFKGPERSKGSDGPDGTRGYKWTKGSKRSEGSQGAKRLGRHWSGRRRSARGPAAGHRTLQLLQRGVAEHQVLDAVVGTEVDLRLSLITVAVRRHHGAEAELVVGHHVPRRQRGHRPVTR